VLYGKEYSENARAVDYENEYAKVTGLFVAPNIVRKNSNYQSFFVNHRYIKSSILSAAVKEACKEKVVAGNFPVFCLNIEVNPALVDVNVHPSKLEVKFSNEREIFDVVYWGVKNALAQNQVIYNLQPSAQKVDAPQATVQSKMVYRTKPSQQILPIKEASSAWYQTTAPQAEFDVKTVWDKTAILKGEKLPEIPFDEKPIGEESTKLESETSILFSPAPVENLAPKEQISFTEPDLKALDTHIIGQLFSTYLLVERGDDLLFVDQHAAHERLNFERLKKAYEAKITYSQMLLEPVTIDLSPVEYQKVLDNLGFFNRIGFETEDFGSGAVIVRMAPPDVDMGQLKLLFLDMLNVVGTKGEEKTITLKALHMVACRSSIKAHDKMSMVEMEKLLTDVLALEDVNTCPHGRPILLTMSKNEIEKGFFRIV